jgi:hypothetical protein
MNNCTTIKEHVEETLIKMLMRQTTYNREEAIASFEKNKTIDKCIEEYLGYQKKEEVLTTNQAIFKSIRDFFDENNSNLNSTNKDKNIQNMPKMQNLPKN